MVVGFEDRKILLPEMGIARLATVKGEEKREIRIVGVKQIQGAQVVSVVAGNRRKKSIQQVVFFFIELSIVDTEYLIEVGACPVHLGHVEVVNHDG
jgi:hypothetical protein